MKHRLAVSALLILFLALTACSSAANHIVGRWKVTSDTSDIVWDFARDGTVTSGDMRGRYSFNGEKRIKIQTPFATFVYQVDIRQDKMTWKNANGSTTELARVK